MSTTCGIHAFGNMTKEKMDQLVFQLRRQGATILAEKPLIVTGFNHGVVLEGEWDEVRNILSISIRDKNWYVPCFKVWDEVDPVMRRVSASRDINFVLFDKQ